MVEVKEVMIKDVFGINSDESVLSAAEIMHEMKIGSLVVRVGDETKGIITERDILGKVICAKKDPATTKVEQIMSSPLVTIHPLASLEEAAEIFNATGFKRLVVSSGDSVDGILSIEDLIAAETTFIEILEKYIQILKAKQ